MTSALSTFRKFSLVLFVAVALGATGCSKKKIDSEDADISGSGDSDSGEAMGLQTVNFPFDSYVLDSETKSKLKANADILKDKTSVRIQIEGHCDERGGIQYNLALGEKRANATRKYLMDMGVSGERMTIISFGKERPVDQGSGESAWARNRRANFVITAR